MGSSRLSKQDGVYTRTASDLERKYNFGKTFADIIGLVNDSRDHVDSVESSLLGSVVEQYTQLARDAERVYFEALESYAKNSDVEEFKQTVESQLTLMAEKISMDFKVYVEEQITDANGDVQKVKEDLEKHFDFDINGLTVKAGDGDLKLRLDNDEIVFYKGDTPLGRWNGDNFYCGNIYVEVNERAQFGNYAFVPFEEGDIDGLDLVRVGG